MDSRSWGAGAPFPLKIRRMMPHSFLTRTFAVSLLLHAGLIGLLALEASRQPIFSDTPLRVRILEPPGTEPAPPQPQPGLESRPKTGRGPAEIPRSSGQPTKPYAPMVTERLARPPIPLPDKPSVSEKPSIPEKPVAAPPSPQVASAPLPEPAAPRSERIPEAPRPAPAVTAPATAAPDRGGLSLGGPSQAAPPLPGSKGPPPSTGGGPARPSLREQIASLGSGLTEDGGGPAKRTVSLENRERQYVDYLSRLKMRIQREWDYPEEALRSGISGELLMVFTLNKAGSLVFIRLIHTSGYPILDEEALRAVKISAPFEPFPPPMGDEPLNIQATFYYSLPRYLRRN
jgi:TonB family protein